ncbi:hypothetical protein [Mucilaginibacter ginkgonis]|uniref:Uncharacterized protein n=1 Tax=Mucilaginibacter ginkgonis TaxID=2682091 RepID=A0A6I4HV47_9SPHI|nr:hypothetical protein [Mucilaginibacter ginkgonis]QQL50007.1 hypothetical protein GO620_000725 [Mucilaginibacter ginkgonis]
MEKEFLKYPGDSPEKEYCQKDWKGYKRLKQIEPIVNDKLNGVETGLENYQSSTAGNNLNLFGKKEWKFFIPEEVTGPIAQYEFKHFKDQIEKYGYMGLNFENVETKIYEPMVAFVLCSNEVKLKDVDTQEIIKVDNHHYRQLYLEGWELGKKDYEAEFPITAALLYSDHSPKLLGDLHYHYYHSDVSNSSYGWEYVKKTCPLMLTENVIKKLGYNSAKLSATDDWRSRYPEVFKEFDNHANKSSGPVNINEGINYHAINNLFDRFYDAYDSIFDQLRGYDYDLKKQNIIYQDTLDEKCSKDFEYILLNNMANKDGLKFFVEDVYYNKIGRLYLLFKQLQSYRLNQLNDDHGVAVKDESFLMISNGYLPAIVTILNQIQQLSAKMSVVTLRSLGDLKMDDYNILGNYIPLEKLTDNQDNGSVSALQEVFLNGNWRFYVQALTQTKPKLLDENFKFIGNRNKHIGVICGYFEDLKKIGIIKPVSRKTLAKALNAALNDFNMGEDGRTFANETYQYSKDFKPQLYKLANLDS